MSTLTCWLNAKKDPSSSTIWLKDKSGLLEGSVFLNLESNEASKILATLIREAFEREVSFEILLDVRDIKMSDKSKTKSVRATLEHILDNMIETVKTEKVSLSDAVLAKANARLAEITSRPVVKRVSVAGVASDEDIFDFLVD